MYNNKQHSPLEYLYRLYIFNSSIFYVVLPYD